MVVSVAYEECSRCYHVYTVTIIFGALERQHTKVKKQGFFGEGFLIEILEYLFLPCHQDELDIGESPSHVVPGASDPADVEDNLDELDSKHAVSSGEKTGVVPPLQLDGEEESQPSSINEELDLGDSTSLELQPEREASPLSQCSSDGSGDSTVKPITKIRKTDKSIGKFEIFFHSARVVRRFQSRWRIGQSRWGNCYDDTLPNIG